MPELPEVEVTRLSIAKGISGAVIHSVAVGKPLRWPLGYPAEGLIGRTITGVRRRGKYLLLDLDHGILLIHLGMSGSLRLGHGLEASGPHDHFEMETTSGTLRLRDPRRFGAVVWAEDEDSGEARKLLGSLGVEPLSELFTVDGLFAGLRASRAPVKQVLLSGKVVVGVGNIYASEVLFLAGIRPTVKSSTIGLARIRRLHAAIREVLARAVERGGSTLRDFASADGSEGHFQLEAYVYGRHNEACRVCGSPVRMIRQGQRSTYYCIRCQKA